MWHTSDMSSPPVKPLIWVGSSLKNLREFPDEVKDEIGFALYEAQCGLKPTAAKPLKSFGGAGVLEIVSDYQSDTFRAVYTVRLEERIYVLHAFQKKSKKGVATPKSEHELIKRRLRQAEELHKERQQKREGKV